MSDREGRKAMGRFSFVTLSLLVVAHSLSGAKVTCSFNWQNRGMLCYKAFKQRVTWKKAERFCNLQESGCHLASIHNKTESADFANYLSQNFENLGGIWIGLNDPMKKGSWEWTDGSNVQYNAWAKGEPNNMNGDEFCAELVERTGGKPGVASEQTGCPRRPRDSKGRKTTGRFVFLSFILLVVVVSLREDGPYMGQSSIWLRDATGPKTQSSQQGEALFHGQRESGSWKMDPP